MPMISGTNAFLWLFPARLIDKFSYKTMPHNDMLDTTGTMNAGETTALNYRHIRSYTLRQGRLTAAQRKAMETLWPRHGLDANQAFEAFTIFGRKAPVIAEIGFGNGESLAQMAFEKPEIDFIGIEVHQPGVGHLLMQLKERGLANVRVYCADAIEVLTRNIADASLAGINLFFPDPWPKKRHHKRRLVNSDFIRLAARKLEKGGFFHAATDWEDYAQHMLSVLENCSEMENSEEGRSFSSRPSYRPLTKFESRGQQMGHGVWDLIFTRR
jgi:tRNA (guanine-N7-)-methyltransferase